MDLWNNTMRRWVKPRSTGISLIRKDSSGWPTLENVFDVLDTRPVKGAKTPYLWQLREDHHAVVAAALERQYGPTDETDIGWALMEQAKRAANGVYRDHLEDLRYDVQNSRLGELDDLGLEARYKNLLTASVQYTVLTRCGLDPSNYLDDNDLSGITEFSTPAVLHHLGDATSEVSKDLLIEIGSAIRRYAREALKNKEKSIEKPLAKSSVIDYTEAREKFSNINRESKERSIDHGEADLHEGRRLPDPRPDAGRTEGK